MTELVDVSDLKSDDPCDRVGSNPTSPTHGPVAQFGRATDS